MQRPPRITAAAVASILLALASMAPVALAQNTTANEGGDLAFGGPGSEPGKFLVLQDIAFDANGVLYALDGVRMNNKLKALEGNLRVQKFDRTGKLLGVIDLKSAPEIVWSEKVTPERVAADQAGHVFVTVPAAGKVLEWDGSGAFLQEIDLPRAMAIATFGAGKEERLAVIPSNHEIVKGRPGWTWVGGDKIVILSTQGTVEKTIPLSPGYENVQDLAVDRAGNFYIKAEPNAVYKVSPEGKQLKVLGGNPTTRNQDGSELLHTVGVDSTGNVYSFAWGNPSVLTRFDADGKTVTQRDGQFKWADPWGTHSNYTPLAIDPDDRIWVGSTGVSDPSGVHYKIQRLVPAIVRTRADFYAPSMSVRVNPVRGLGFRPDLKSTLPLNVSYELNVPITMQLAVGAANRNVASMHADWHVYDALKSEVAHGALELPLENGQAATASFQWSPTRYGAYFVHVLMSAPEGDLGGIGEHVAVTPRFPGLPELGAESKGGWSDTTRQIWTGLTNVRIHPMFRAGERPSERAEKWARLEEQIAAAEKAGATFLVQIVDSQKNFNADDVREIVERFKGRLKYVEVCNEPNFSGSVDDYFKIHQTCYQTVKEVDPSVQVMGPATVNLDLRWLTRLYELGFKECSDIISMHDYEGHESIDPVHWKWKYGEIRKIMAANGDESKPIWQTERAISGVRGLNFQGLVQAIRLPLHQDLLETLGIPSAHDNHYYLNQAGYSSVPTYVWSNEGPMPAAVAMRTRHALTAARGRVYAGELDFGPTGNTLYQGVRYAGPSGETIVLRNLGAPTGIVAFDVNGTPGSLKVTDTWGNDISAAVALRTSEMEVGQLPIYVELLPGQKFEPKKIDFGHNVAPRAEFVYSSTSKNSVALLNNGIVETYFDKDPNGDTNGQKIWQGDLPTPGQTLEIRFPRPQPVNKVILRTPHPDNTFCTLLDYDIQAWDGSTWKIVAELHRPMPLSEVAVTADARNAIWMDDTNAFMHEFRTVTTDKLRLVVRQTTHGFVPDDRARAWSNIIPSKLMLREVEVYAAETPVELEVTLQGQGTAHTLQAKLRNRGAQPVTATLRGYGPVGWKLETSIPVKLPAHGEQMVEVPVTVPSVMQSGKSFVDLELRGSQEELLGSGFVAINTDAPVELLPQLANASEANSKGALVKLAVKNTSAVALSGSALVHVSGPREVSPQQKAFGPVAPGESATVEWRVPGIDAAKERWSATYEVVANGVQTTASKELFGQSWSVVGPFPRGFDVPEGPEKAFKFNPGETFTDMVGTNLHWQVIRPSGEGMVNLADNIKPNTECMAYAVTIVNSPRAQKALFSVGTDDGGKGWLNGKVVYSDDGGHGAAPGQTQVPVELQAGRNEVWLKVTQGTGGWGFFFDLLDPVSGKPLGDVVYRVGE